MKGKKSLYEAWFTHLSKFFWIKVMSNVDTSLKVCGTKFVLLIAGKWAIEHKLV